MRQVDLQEYASSDPIFLSVTERDELVNVLPSLDIAPAPGIERAFILHPGSTVGAVDIGDLSVLIQPKIGIPHLLWMASYAIGKVSFRPEDFDYPDNCQLPDVLALALTLQARRAFSRGLLHGYVSEEEALYSVRGRIRFDEQIRRRFNIPLPVEVRYDEFTDDILANRLVKAAAQQLGRVRLRSPKARRDLGWVAGILDSVSPVEFPSARVPTVTFDRLNEHYRSVVELSRLILQHRAFESSRGRVRAAGFLLDMTRVFQEFVTVALREALGLSQETFGENYIPSLDKRNRVNLKPDLVWWSGGRYRFVGDAKYKRLNPDAPNADIYQMLAYCTAADLPSGLLIYAKEESESSEPGVHRIRNANKTIEVASIDLEGEPEAILKEVGRLAGKIKAHDRQELRAPVMA